MNNRIQSNPIAWRGGRFRIYTVVALGFWAIAATSQATIIFRDDFNGALNTVVDPTIWASNPTINPLLALGGTLPSKINGSGEAIVTTGGQTFGRGLAALPAYNEAPTPVNGNEIKLTVKFDSIFDTAGSFGLNDFGPNAIIVHSGFVVGEETVDIITNGVQHTVNLFPTSASAVTWTFDWTPSQIVISTNGVSVFTTTTDIPTVALAPYVFHYNPGTPDTLVDFVQFENGIIPEPSTIMLLSLGGLLLWRRRARS